MQIVYFVFVYTVFDVRGTFGQCSGSAQSVSVGYTSVSFTTPDFPSPGYPLNSDCAWLGTSSETGARLLFRVTHIDVDCAGDAINVYDGADNTGSLKHTNECGSSRTLGYQTTTSSNVYTTFISDNSETTPTNEQGFTMYMISGKDFSGTGCSASQPLTATSTEQYISSPNFPDTYSASASCTWVITTTDATANVVIDIKFLNIESESTCSYDFFEIKESGTTVRKVCQEHVDNDWNTGMSDTSTGNSFTVVFSSDNQGEKMGFLLSYKQTGDSTTTTEVTSTETPTTISDATTTAEVTSTETLTALSDSTTTTEVTSTETPTTITIYCRRSQSRDGGSDSTQNTTTNDDDADSNAAIIAGTVTVAVVGAVCGGIGLAFFLKKQGLIGTPNINKIQPTEFNDKPKHDTNFNNEPPQSTKYNVNNKDDITYPDCIYTMPDCYKDMSYKQLFSNQIL